MFQVIHNTLLVYPIFNLLAVFIKLTGSLGISIILLTIFIKLISTPMILPSLRSMKKQRELQPELDKLKKKYAYDKKKLAEKQMELMKQHGLNPASGCYTMILSILIFTALYSVIRQIIQAPDITEINTHIYFNLFKFPNLDVLNTKFLWMNLEKPDPYRILAVFVGVLQFFVAKMNLPYNETGIEAAAKTPDKKDDIAYNMQQQSLYIMPGMMALLGFSLPAGVIIYMITSNLFSLVQNYLFSGWGGLKPWAIKLGLTKK